MKVSVITCCLNAESTIADNIQSVNRQSFKCIEHLILDGKSSDDTVGLVSRLSNRDPIIFSEIDSGPLEAFNKGIARSTGDVIGFLNSDDFFANSHVVENIVKAFEDPEVMGCYANVTYVDRQNINSIRRIWQLGPYSERALRKGWAPAHPTFYVRRSVFNNLGNFNEQFNLQSDFEFALRFFYRHKLKARYINENWVYMRTGGISNRSLNGILKQNYENIRACRLHGIKVGWGYFIMRISSRLKQYFFAFFSN
jgi:glycosyltransferase involved in cell wall biosynthesis